jgi:transglutaminase-like putative cysteine protease
MNRRQAYILSGRAEFKDRKIKTAQSAQDITALLLYAVRNSMPQARKIVAKFKGKTPEETAFNVWEWTRKNLVYDREANTAQTAKTVSRFLADGFGDCKHFSTINAAIFKALNMPVYFRVIDQIGRFNHIYTVLKYPGKTIYVDSVYPYFDQETNYNRKEDIKV